MKIAVIGGGISGMVAAWLLARDHEITLFEANETIGGHTHTVDVLENATRYPVDTGFIVFNEKTYPNFVKLLRHLGIEWQPSDMSFSVKCETTGLEYNGTSINSLFAQRSNMLRPSFLGMIRDILKFNRAAKDFASNRDDETTLGEFLSRGDYGSRFVDHYIVPMGAAIWSSDPAQMRSFPFRYFARFFDNHGMLNIDDRPQWLVIKGGSRSYVEALTRPYADRIRLSTPIASVSRESESVVITPRGGSAETFDKVVIAAHADQALRMLSDPSDQERDVLSAFAYQKNDTVLHTDATILPKQRRAWGAWNYHVDPTPTEGPKVTYWMNRLQSLGASQQYCVTLNRTHAIEPERVIGRYEYEHPIYDYGTVASQSRHDDLNGARGTYYCGAYWGFGFHEDGVNSALAVGRHFGRGEIS